MKKMKFQNTVGIDVSKETLDVVIHKSQQHRKFENNPKGFKQMLRWIICTTKIPVKQILICFENTGWYSLLLASFLSEQKISFCMESPLRIKRSLGLAQGKSDKVDACNIAHYAYEKQEEIKITNIPSPVVLKLKNL